MNEHYMIVRAGLLTLEGAVNEHMRQGYIPLGAPLCDGGKWCQAMVSRDFFAEVVMETIAAMKQGAPVEEVA